jgi:hypothetical protein
VPPFAPPPRLGLIQARAAPVAVLFRRGPSRRVELVRWDTRADTFQRGHWFHGRIYDRRSDLSPDGALLVYFAARHTVRAGEPPWAYSWTAVSRPPWLTALALWPKGDSWWGGGAFADNRTLLLNHRPHEAEPHPEHRPRGLRVVPDPDACGEDDPLYGRRLERDGWRLHQAWEGSLGSYRAGWVTAAPEIRSRGHRAHDLRLRFERWRRGRRHFHLFAVLAPNGEELLELGEVDWADWDHAGRLIVLRGGAVHAAPVDGARIGDLRTLVDLTADVPEPRAPPEWARSW